MGVVERGGVGTYTHICNWDTRSCRKVCCVCTYMIHVIKRYMYINDQWVVKELQAYNA